LLASLISALHDGGPDRECSGGVLSYCFYSTTPPLGVLLLRRRRIKRELDNSYIITLISADNQSVSLISLKVE
jgi:hypothetical protein